VLKFTGSISGNCTVILPSAAGSEWLIDATQCTLNAHTITLQANGVNWGTTIGVTNEYFVSYSGVQGKLYGTSMSP
jgi:hypothetical protein